MATAQTTDPQPLGTLVRIALLSVATAVGAAAIGYFPTQAASGTPGLAAMAVGLAIAWCGLLAGLVPWILALHSGPRQQLGGMLAGMAVRFLLTLALLLAALLSCFWPRLPLAVWTGIGYILLLAVETAALARYAKRAARTRS
jgi:hypothetical protein